ncbi:unnamed protein product, partial [Prorocentrum cordatum]
AGGFVTSEGRVDGNLNLSRALGDFAYKKDPKLKQTEQKISCEAEMRTRALTAADRCPPPFALLTAPIGRGLDLVALAPLVQAAASGAAAGGGGRHVVAAAVAAAARVGEVAAHSGGERKAFRDVALHAALGAGAEALPVAAAEAKRKWPSRQRAPAMEVTVPLQEYVIGSGSGSGGADWPQVKATAARSAKSERTVSECGSVDGFAGRPHVFDIASESGSEVPLAEEGIWKSGGVCSAGNFGESVAELKALADTLAEELLEARAAACAAGVPGRRRTWSRLTDAAVQEGARMMGAKVLAQIASMPLLPPLPELGRPAGRWANDLSDATKLAVEAEAMLDVAEGSVQAMAEAAAEVLEGGARAEAVKGVQGWLEECGGQSCVYPPEFLADEGWD